VRVCARALGLKNEPKLLEMLVQKIGFFFLIKILNGLAMWSLFFQSNWGLHTMNIITLTHKHAHTQSNYKITLHSIQNTHNTHNFYKKNLQKKKIHKKENNQKKK